MVKSSPQKGEKRSPFSSKIPSAQQPPECKIEDYFLSLTFDFGRKADDTFVYLRGPSADSTIDLAATWYPPSKLSLQELMDDLKGHKCYFFYCSAI